MSQIPIEKQVFDKNQFGRVIDTQFRQLLIQQEEEEIPSFTIEDFFELYDQLFYQIPREGDTNSHQYILQREADYLGISISQDDVQAFWKSAPFDLQLEFRDGVTAMGNCDLCFLKGPHQIMGLVKNYPEMATWWANMEHKIGATFRSDRPSYSNLQSFVDKQGDMFDTEGGISCFCGD